MSLFICVSIEVYLCLIGEKKSLFIYTYLGLILNLEILFFFLLIRPTACLSNIVSCLLQSVIKLKEGLSILCVRAKSLQLYPALCDPMDCSPPDSSLQGFTRQEYWSEWIVMPSSKESSLSRDRTCVSWGSCITGRFFTAEHWRSPEQLVDSGKCWQWLML